jgi:hypothetical protein
MNTIVLRDQEIRMHEVAKSQSPLGGLDAQFSELVEVVWACEREWALEDRIDAAISCYWRCRR